jgi:hypothetical protein
MAWVRIHDGAMGNLKIMRLSNSAFRLWIRGLCYCQTHLTDGLIPREALKFLDAKRADVDVLSSVLVPGKSSLWERIESFGFKVHDYLDWNDSREVVEQKRAGGRRRVQQHREQSSTSFTVSEVDQCNALRNAHTPSGVVLSEALVRSSEGEPERKSSPPTRSGRNAGRIFLHRWQQDALVDIIGPHVDVFALDEFLDNLNAKIATAALPRDPWKFVQSELHSELSRRGLAVAEVAAVSNGRTNIDAVRDILRRDGVIE